MNGEQLQIRVEGTPNPNAAKFVLDREIPCGRSRSYMSPEEARENPLAARLFAIEGVRALLFVENFITVTKTEEAEWDELVERIAETIRSGLTL